MGSLKSFHEHQRNSQSQARKLTEAGPALNALFATEGIRLEREDEVSILRVVHRAIVEQLRRAKEIEASLSCGHSQMNAVLFLTELTVTAMVSKGNRMSAIEDYLLRKASDRKQPFGLAMVCIGLRGLPDDARVVSISQLARESNRTE
ncbi:MAG: hypothetical protein OEV56_05690, partial [Dehalococcoidia bacterium]|nr:hypothetical protein [Dehalococcoidia bacterium]